MSLLCAFEFGLHLAQRLTRGEDGFSVLRGIISLACVFAVKPGMQRIDVTAQVWKTGIYVRLHLTWWRLGRRRHLEKSLEDLGESER